MRALRIVEYVLCALKGKFVLRLFPEWPLCSKMMPNGMGSNDTKLFFVGTVTQLVILPPHIPRIGHGGRWYTVVMLLYDLCSCLAIFDLNGQGENRSPYL